MHHLIKWIAVASAVAAAGNAAVADSGPERGQLFLSLLGGSYEEPDDLDLRKGDTDLSGAVGVALHDRWSVEAMWFGFEPHYEIGGVRGRDDMDYWSVNVLGKIGDPKGWQPYFTVGGGRATYKYDDLQPEVEDNLYNAGLGFFADVTERLSFRADVRAVYHHDLSDVSPMVTAGLTLMLGGKPAPRMPVDSDGDGVPDDEDACAGTPRGADVDSRGCPRVLDGDGDGVSDDRDRCPGTAAGVAVNQDGCPLDRDRDGVLDDRDACPDTPAGARVDKRGCEVVLERPVSFDLTVEFAFDSAEITGAEMQQMLQLLRFLREYPSATAVIEGHSDDQGPAAYNQRLSERRANAVLEALVRSGMDRARLTARGLGESQPIASNDTEEGRAQNRRVAVVVSGTTTNPG